MKQSDAAEILGLLREIRDGQKLQLERQAEVLSRQADAAARQEQRRARSDAIFADAESIARNASENAKALRRASVMAYLILPFTLLLLVVVCWMLFHK